MANEIKTLYSDENKQNALYPRTKFSAVSDDDGNTLGNVASYTSEVMESGVDDIKVYGMPPLIDTSNVLFEETRYNGGANKTYTATEDCIMIYHNTMAYWNGTPKLNDVTIVPYNMSDGISFTLFLKKGDVFTYFGGGGAYASLKVFGVKY